MSLTRKGKIETWPKSVLSADMVLATVLSYCIYF